MRLYRDKRGTVVDLDAVIAAYKGRKERLGKGVTYTKAVAPGTPEILVALPLEEFIEVWVSESDKTVRSDYGGDND